MTQTWTKARSSSLQVMTLAIGLLLAPLSVAAQPVGKPYRIGYLTSANIHLPFREALRDIGYVEGQNVVLEVRQAAGKLDQLPALAADLVRLRVDVIVAASPPAIEAAKEATKTIPIVMGVTSVDPITSRFVDSLARPGGNITGVSMIADHIAGKRLALLKEMIPRVTRVAVLTQTSHSAGIGQVKAARDAAKTLGVELDEFPVRDSRDYASVFAEIGKRSQAVFVVANPTFFEDRELLADMGKKHRLPLLCEWREMAVAGCLMAYGPNLADLTRRVAMYVQRIERGARPADLPVEQPTKFDLFINPTTAQLLGVAVPELLLVQAELVP